MKKILLALSVLFFASGCFAEDIVKEQHIVPVNDVTFENEAKSNQTESVELPKLRDIVDNGTAASALNDENTSVGQNVENANYNTDTEYLLEKINSFEPINVTKKVIVRTVDESEIEIPDDIVSDEEILEEQPIVKDVPQKIEFEDKVAMTGLYCKFYSSAVLKQPRTNLTWVEKFKLRRYFKRIAKKEFKSIYYSGSAKAVARVKIVIDRNGKIVKAKIEASNYNKKFNKEILDQLRDIELPKFNISVQEIVGVYHFDNIKYMDK